MLLIRLFLLCLFSLVCIVSAKSQNKVTISGNVEDALSGEQLIGATIKVEQNENTGTTTDVNGEYSLSLPAGTYRLRFNYVGYSEEIKEITLRGKQVLNVRLNPAEVELKEVIVSSEKQDANVSEVSMGKDNLSIELIRKLPAFLGEVDVLKTVQLLPGVLSAGEGTTGLFIRGGSADQNLILLDKATVYNPAHFLGFFSVFNPDAIQSLDIYKGGIPARFGGRLSSILDIRMREGNKENYVLSGGIGSISSRLTAEGPLVKGKSSFLLSGRRTYADVFLRLSSNENLKSSTLFFYDLNGKADFTINDKNRLYLSGYFGRDVFAIENLFGINWGNTVGTAHWDHSFNKDFFLTTSLLYSKYDYGFDADDGVNSFIWKSSLEEKSLNLNFTWQIKPRSTLTFGSNTIYHTFSPPKITFEGETTVDDILLFDRFGLEQAFFAGHELELNPKLSIEYGLRYSLFQNIGPSKVYLYEEGKPLNRGTITDTLDIGRFEKIQFYDGLEPRFGARYLVGENSSLKASYNRMRQYLQIASNATAGLPIDRWIPADRYIRPLIGDQLSLGYFRNINDNMFETSIEVYYKRMQRLIDFKPAAQILLTNSVETEVLEGKGWAYGTELLIRKNKGRTTGWIGYTLSRTMRQVPGISNDQPYPARYDRTHDIAVVVNQELGSRWSVAGNFIYSTGAAVTFPVGRTRIIGQSIPVYDDGQRNANRMPDYHRLDLSATLRGKVSRTRKWQGDWVFSIYNVYARKNAFTITFEEVYNNKPSFNPERRGTAIENKKPGAVKLYLFSVIPSVTYNFNFKL